MKGCKISEKLIKEIEKNGLKITRLNRLNYSGGVMEVAGINNKYLIRLDNFWNSYWTKKWNELSDNDFHTWLSGILNKRLIEIKEHIKNLCESDITFIRK